MYAPVVVRESAPRMTPLLKVMAILVAEETKSANGAGDKDKGHGELDTADTKLTSRFLDCEGWKLA